MAIAEFDSKKKNPGTVIPWDGNTDMITSIPPATAAEIAKITDDLARAKTDPAEQIYLRWMSFNGPRAVMFGYKKDVVDMAVEAVSPIHWHTELQFQAKYDYISYSNTMRENEGRCARFKHITYTNPEYWDIVFIPVTERQEDLAYEQATRDLGTPYDLFGGLSLTSKLNLIKPSPDKTWCNEACGLVLNAALGDQFYGHRPDSLTPTEADFLLRLTYGKK